MAWESFALTREQIHEAVWATPTQTVAAKLGLTGTGLAKICAKLSIPVPPRGYWAKKAVGAHVSPAPPLPAALLSTPERYEFKRYDSPYGTDKFSREATLSIERERSADIPIAVPEVLTDPHPLTQLSAKVLRRATATSRPDLLLHNRMLDVTVSKGCEDRALRIFDTLIKQLGQRGFGVEVTDPEPATERRRTWQGIRGEASAHWCPGWQSICRVRDRGTSRR